ncbi:hypothetical protein [Streptomyces scabiei]|uniref:hypothetical protein n=1 Tax=Streptomyces scabiei TaxID=1930 RepID=UPI0029B8392A|nr:hypothetical protein [Streptomyces scabiei]MDX2802666.1 hypothetical protein [Streptomyces scabiei]MDX3277239.1 hypothetical protein [Streptomyces scabiei]
MTLLDGLDQALTEASRKPSRRKRQRRTRIGWRQVAVQVLCVVAVAAFVAALLSHGTT